MQTKKCLKRWRWLALAVAAATLLGFMPSTQLTSTARADASTRDEAELTAQWWQWAFSIPASTSPLSDDHGEFAFEGQPYNGNKVMFLAGVFNASGTAERRITVPKGTSFFFPLVNYVWINDSGAKHRERYPENLTVPQMYSTVEGAIDLVETDSLYATLNGVNLSYARVQSSPFTAKLPADNINGVPAGTYSPGVSDGYWCYIPPLKSGTYMLKFGAYIGDPVDFGLDITYYITVE